MYKDSVESKGCDPEDSEFNKKFHIEVEQEEVAHKLVMKRRIDL